MQLSHIMNDNGTATVKEFLNFIQYERGYSSNTIKAYEGDLDLFLNFLKKYNESLLEDFSKIDRQTIRHFLGKEYEEGNSSKTVARRLASIKSLFKYLVHVEVVLDNPALHVKTPKVEKRIPTFVQSNKIKELMNVKTFVM